MDWPRGEPLANYTRTMNWDAATMTEEFDRKPGLNPASWKWGIGWAGGTPLQQQSRQKFVVNGQYGWHHDGPGSAPVAAPPDDAELWQLEMWLNPHGFLKAARLPGANPVAVWRWELGEMGRDGPTTVPEKVTVVSIRMLGKYRVDATINKEHMLQRIHTWVPHPVLGDMNYEHEFTNASYVDVGNGVAFPDRLASPRGLGRQLQHADDHRRPQRLWRDVQGRQCDLRVTVLCRFRTPSARRRSRSGWTRRSSPTACTCWAASTHNSVAIEFKDFVAVDRGADRRGRGAWP